MVSKKKEDLDDFDFDDLDFDEFSVEDADQPKDDRNPVSRFGGKVLESVKNAFVDSENIERAVKSTLPDGYSVAWDFASRVKDDVTDIYDEAAKEMRPAARELQKHVKRVTPAIEGRLPSFVQERLKRFNEKDFSVQSTQSGTEDGKEHELAESLSAVFAKHSEDQKTQFAKQEETQQKERVERKLNTRVGQLQTLEQTRVLEQIKDYNERIVSYQDSILHRYQQKSLEIQYRSYFVQRDQLKVLQSHAVTAKEQLAAIIHNTALPEAQKIKKLERAGEMLRDRFLGKMGQTASDFTQKYYQNAMTKLKKSIVGGVRDVTGAITGMTDTVGSMDMGEGGPGVMDLITDMIGRTITAKVTEMAGGSIGARLIKRFPKIAKDSEHLKYLVSNPAELAKAFKESDYGDGTFLESPLDLLKEALPTRQLTKDLKGTDITKMNDARHFDEQTHLTLNQVIPTYLSNIHQELRMIRTGELEQVSDRMVFDIEKGQMSTLAERTATVERRVFNRNNSEAVNSKINEALTEMGVDITQDERFITLVRAQIQEDLRNGIAGGFNPDYYGSKSTRQMTHLKGKDRERFSKLIDQKFVNQDGSTNWGAVNESGEHLKRAQASLGDPDAIAQAYMEVGYQEDLRNLGVIGQNNRELQWDDINLRFAGLKLSPKEIEAYQKLVAELEKQKMRSEEIRNKAKKVKGFVESIAKGLGVSPDRVEKAFNEYGEKTGLTSLYRKGTKTFRDLYRSGKQRFDQMRSDQNSLYNQAVDRVSKLRERVTESETYQEFGQWVMEDLNVNELKRNPFTRTTPGYNTQKEEALSGQVYTPGVQPVWSPTPGQMGGGIPPRPPVATATFAPEPQPEHHPQSQYSRTQSVHPNASYNWNMIAEPIGQILHILQEVKEPALSTFEHIQNQSDRELIELQQQRKTLDEERNQILKQILETNKVSVIVSQGQDPNTYIKTQKPEGQWDWMGVFKYPIKGLGALGKGFYKYTKGVYGAIGTGVMGAAHLVKGTASGLLNSIGATKNPWGDIVSFTTGKVLLVGKYLKEGRYMDERTQKPITKLKDITGPVIDIQTGNQVLTQEDFDNKFYQKAKGLMSATGSIIGQIGGGVAKVAGSALGLYGEVVKLGYNVMTAPLRSLNRALRNKEPKDVYVTGDNPWVPRLLGRVIKIGGYLLKETGKPLKSHLDAKNGIVIDAVSKNVIIDIEDHHKGLVDYRGRPIDASLTKSLVGAVKWAGGWAARGAKGYVDLVYGAVGAIKDVTLGFLGIPGKIRGMMGSKDQGYWYSHAEKLMSVVVAIHDMLDARIPKPLRKGGWEEQVANRKAKKAEEEKELKEAAKDAKSPVGRFLAALGGGISGLLGKLTGADDEEEEDDDEGSWTDLLPDWMYWGGKDKEGRRRRRRARARAKRMRRGKVPRGKIGRLLHGARAIFSRGPKPTPATVTTVARTGQAANAARTAAAVNRAKTGITLASRGRTALTAARLGMLGIGGSGLGVGGTAAATGTAATAGSVAAGTAAGVGAGAAGTAGAVGGGILGGIALPVAAVVAVVGAGAYFGYRKYKYTANQPIRSYRFAQYGLDDSDTDTAIAVGKLERYLEERSKIVGGKLEFDPEKMTQEENQEILEMFDGDTDWWNLWGDANAESRTKFQYWYFDRFNPIFRLWKETLAKYDAQMSIVDIDENLDAEKQMELLSTINRDTPKSAYQIHYSPFKEHDRLPVDEDGISHAYAKARNYVQNRMKGIKTSRAGQVISTFMNASPAGQIAALTLKATGLDKVARNSEIYQKNMRMLPGFMQETFKDLGLLGEGHLNDRKQTAQRLSELTGLNRKPTPFEQLRFFVYGLSKLEVKKVDALFLLEQHVVEDFTYTEQHRAEHMGGYKKYWKLLATRFDQMESDSDAEDRFQTWFERRFLPAALLFASKSRQLRPDVDPLKIEQNAETKTIVDIAKEMIGAEYDAWGWNNPSVWSERTSPWGEQDVLNTDPTSVKPLILAIQDQDRHAKEPEYPVAQAPKDDPQTAQSRKLEEEKRRQEQQRQQNDQKRMVKSTQPASQSQSATASGAETATSVTGSSKVELMAGTGGLYRDLPEITRTSSESEAMPLLEAVGRQMGIDPGVLARIVRRESAFKSDAKARTSSASGLFQFINGTWRGMMKQYGDQLGIPKDASPFDPRANALLGAQYALDNYRAIQSVKGDGAEVTEGELYAAHFLGTTGAQRMLRQSLSAPVSAGMSADQLKANPQIKSHWTVADFWNWTNAKAQGRNPVQVSTTASTTPPAPLPAEPAQSKQTEQSQTTATQVMQNSLLYKDAFSQQANRMLSPTVASRTPSSAIGNMNIAVSGKRAKDAVDFAKRNAAPKSLGRCAKYVNDSLRKQGISIHGHGRDVAKNLISNCGFTEVAWDQNYQPMHGDVMSMSSPPGHHHNYGHVAIYDAERKQWISDFVQRNRGDGRHAAPGDRYLTSVRNGTLKTTIARFPEAAGFTPATPTPSPQMLNTEQLAAEEVPAPIEDKPKATFAGITGGVESHTPTKPDKPTNPFADVTGGTEINTPSTSRLMQDRNLTASVSTGTEVNSTEYPETQHTEESVSITQMGADPITQYEQQAQVLDRVTVSAAAEQERIDQESQQLASILNEQLTVQTEMRDILTQWYNHYQKRETETLKQAKVAPKEEQSKSSFEDRKRHQDIYRQLMSENQAADAPIRLRRNLNA